ncbi:hypothetical protein [Actinospica robiniae]|uniref:hypothetical protein n=1 Tax=Actinospica robiniae TaxID=304901 RepID=UPI00040BCDBC|nr:hypothetical protein [Actinospica robiniae]
MHRKVKGRAALSAAVLVSSSVLATVGSVTPAMADSVAICPSSGGSSGGGGGGGGDTYKMWEVVNQQITSCSNGGNAAQSDGSSGSASIVPCWWAPAYDPAGLQGYVQAFESTSSTDNWYTMLAKEYDTNGTDAPPSDYKSDSGPPWDSYNVGTTPLGEWYGMFYNSAASGDQLDTCSHELAALGAKQFYWADNEDQPTGTPAEIPVFTDLELAQYVESVVLLPAAQVKSSQGRNDAAGDPARATVGLPIWYWQDEGTTHTKVDQEVCVFGTRYCVDFTAYAVSFTIDRGSAPGRAWSGDCVHQSSNTLGPEWHGQSASVNPTCGVEYSTLARGVTPTVYTTWHVHITWDGGDWSPPNDPVIATTLDPFDVQDIQAYNRTSPSATPSS